MNISSKKRRIRFEGTVPGRRPPSPPATGLGVRAAGAGRRPLGGSVSGALRHLSLRLLGRAAGGDGRSMPGLSTDARHSGSTRTSVPGRRRGFHLAGGFDIKPGVGWLKCATTGGGGGGGGGGGAACCCLCRTTPLPSHRSIYAWFRIRRAFAFTPCLSRVRTHTQRGRG